MRHAGLFLVCMLTAVALYGSEPFSKVKLGAGTDEGNFYGGIDLMTPSMSEYEDAVAMGSIGIGVEYLNYESATKPTQTYGSVYSLGFFLKAGYDTRRIVHLPLQLKAGVGYGVLRVEDVNYWGAAYSVGLEANLYKGAGLGVGHVWQQSTLGTWSDTVLYFTLVF